MMEITLPLPALVIFVMSHLLPVGVNQMETTIEGHKLTWTRNEAGLWQPQVPNPLGDATFEVEGQKVKVVPKDKPYYTLNVDEYLELPEKTPADYWSTVKTIKLKHAAFGSEVAVKREKEKVTFSQTKGQLAENPVVVSWQASTEKAGDKPDKAAAE